MSVMLWRGLRNRCPICGGAPVFAGYLRVVDACASCGTPLGRARADDAPPYFTIFAVGHLILPLLLWLEMSREPPLWVHAAIFLPLTLGGCLALLRPFKGATVGLMLKLGLVKTDAEDA